jgi:hypothetical protein
MRFFNRNFHVYVFSLVSLLSAVWVANNPEQTVHLVRPVVEDAIELKQLAEGVYREVGQLNWQTASEEAVTIFVAAMRMPTMLFERLAERIENVETDIKQRQRVDASGAAVDRRTKDAGLSVKDFEHVRRQDTESRSPLT